MQTACQRDTFKRPPSQAQVIGSCGPVRCREMPMEDPRADVGWFRSTMPTHYVRLVLAQQLFVHPLRFDRLPLRLEPEAKYQGNSGRTRESSFQHGQLFLRVSRYFQLEAPRALPTVASLIRPRSSAATASCSRTAHSGVTRSSVNEAHQQLTLISCAPTFEHLEPEIVHLLGVPRSHCTPSGQLFQIARHAGRAVCRYSRENG